MIHWREGTVCEVTTTWPGVHQTRVELTAALPGRGDDDRFITAIAYTDMVGTPAAGDRVLVNVSALARRLGTGGFGLIVALPQKLPDDPPPQPGHMVKDRYAPLQTMVLGVDDQESEHHATIRDTSSLSGLPVVVADLHSALPAILAGIRAANPELRVVYVMTDGAALPLPFSRSVAELRECGWLAATISVGQAYGGDYEAVTIHSALLAAAEVAGADVVIVSQGPGNLGTGTPYGFTGMMVADHLNAAAFLGGLPIAAARMSNADARGRHFGISHHTLTAVGRAANPGCLVPLPDLTQLTDAEVAAAIGAEGADPRAVIDTVDSQLPELSRQEVDWVDPRGLLAELQQVPVRLSTMGRGLSEDPLSFIAAAAAGTCAAGRLA
ncbi:DUF3866 family protein [Brevibacterium sp. p3-SID960]|uniref:DUF3866 family protein n=1 Tax=Brevibacterium sp. p3-SID960 TaxID=2916063 RepID=UPI0021A4D2A8|nr:DUF3866 family protein [Brevibacterium sp. p3-SID960]MCT1690407.1 DUF3866 family protein [Brevibacterium sp. p3-SID960]